MTTKELVDKGLRLFNDNSYNEAYACFLQASESNNIEAVFHLGLCYARGLGCPKDTDKATECCEYCAKNGHAEAQYNMFIRCKNIDLDQAIGWLKKSAENQYDEAIYEIGLASFTGDDFLPKDLNNAARWLTIIAQKGHVDAQNLISEVYLRMNQFDNAFYWIEQAALNGHPAAEHTLGRCYYYGQGQVQCYDKAFKWFEKSSEKDFAPAYYSLGICYKEGHGVKKETDIAYSLFCKSAAKGDPYAYLSLGDMDAAERQDYEKAFDAYMKAAEMGVPRAQYRLFELLISGTGCERNSLRAMFWLNKAQEAGDKMALLQPRV